jgi:hypothetical protein
MSGNKIGEEHLTLSGYRGKAADVSTALSVRPCTVKDVARLAGVSLATVSRVVNCADNVSSDTRMKVLIAVSKLRYSPNLHAAELGRANGGISRKRGV